MQQSCCLARSRLATFLKEKSTIFLKTRRWRASPNIFARAEDGDFKGGVSPFGAENFLIMKRYLTHFHAILEFCYFYHFCVILHSHTKGTKCLNFLVLTSICGFKWRPQRASLTKEALVFFILRPICLLAPRACHVAALLNRGRQSNGGTRLLILGGQLTFSRFYYLIQLKFINIKKLIQTSIIIFYVLNIKSTEWVLYNVGGGEGGVSLYVAALARVSWAKWRGEGLKEDVRLKKGGGRGRGSR